MPGPGISRLSGVLRRAERRQKTLGIPTLLTKHPQDTDEMATRWGSRCFRFRSCVREKRAASRAAAHPLHISVERRVRGDAGPRQKGCSLCLAVRYLLFFTWRGAVFFAPFPAHPGKKKNGFGDARGPSLQAISRRGAKRVAALVAKQRRHSSEYRTDTGGKPAGGGCVALFFFYSFAKTRTKRRELKLNVCTTTIARYHC